MGQGLSENPFFLLVLVLSGLLLLLSSFRRIVRRPREPVSPAPSPRDALLRYQERVDDMELRLLEFHREIDARCQNKLDLLRAVVAEAEARISELRELLDRGGY